MDWAIYFELPKLDMNSMSNTKQKLNELIEQRTQLERQIQDLQKAARAGALSEIRDLMNKHGLTVEDLAGATRRGEKKSANKGSSVKAKYEDGQGNTWTGRGLRPRWLTSALEANPGKTLDDFLIKS